MGKSRQQPQGGASSYQPDNYPAQLPLPKKSREAFGRKQSPNIGLLFERYTQFQDGWVLKDIGKRKPSSKQYLLDELSNTSIGDEERKAFAQRWQKMVAPAEAWRMTPTWRFVTGMGNKTALEVGFTFHRVYGFPYIPSSSLKGLARAVALLEIAQQADKGMIGLQDAVALLSSKTKTPMQELETALLEETETFPTKLRAWAADTGYKKVATLADQFRKVFGTQYSVGKAIFHDAIPAAKPTLEVDVMTVHYPDYYQKDKPPADTQSPTPIPFLTVGQVPFWFAVGWQGDPDQAAYDKAIEWLKFGLMEFGAGAKTAVGYGHFQA
jgi:CRISPR-associated protein Cmr6